MGNESVDKSEVLAWMREHPECTALETVHKFWGPESPERDATRTALVRQWASRAKRHVSAGALPVDARPSEALTRDEWLCRQLVDIDSDLRRARGKGGDPRLIPGLTKTAKELRAELDEVRRTPPPDPSAFVTEIRPLLSLETIRELAPSHLSAVIAGLMGVTEPTDGDVEEEIERHAPPMAIA